MEADVARRVLIVAGIAALFCAAISGSANDRVLAQGPPDTATLRLASRHLVMPAPQSRTLRLDNWFYETAAGRVIQASAQPQGTS